MRIRGARVIVCLALFGAARGCYSSVAPTAKIDPGIDDSGLPVLPPPPNDACAPRKPWEGPGVTGVLPVGPSSALVLSGDRYFNADFDTSSFDASDSTLGRVLSWRETGLLKDLWATAPAIVGQKPWDDPGVTTAYLGKGGGPQLIISRFRRWVHDGDQWPAAGNVVDDWIVADAGPPPIDGAVPWEGPGVTAAFFEPGGAQFFVVSQNKGWSRKTSDPDPRNWTWLPEGGVMLANAQPWSSAPAVAGQKPHEGKGVTAAYYVGPKLFVVSVDKMWSYDGSRWSEAGLVKDMPGWGSAPTTACAK